MGNSVGRLLISGAALLILGAANRPEHRYGDTLLADAMQRFPAVTGLAITVVGKHGGPISIMEGDYSRAQVGPLSDAMGATIGTVAVATEPTGGSTADKVAAYLARRIYISDSLNEPDPIVAGARRAPFAQALINRTLDQFPKLVTLAMHVAPPRRSNIIIASSFGRIGKPADSDDLSVITTDTVLREVTNGGARLAVELPLTDRVGRTIGALSTSFETPVGSDPQAACRQAVQIRDALAQSIRSLHALLEQTGKHSTLPMQQ